MSKKKRRPKLNLRPKGDKQDAPESRTEQTVRELAHQLFEEKGGKAIDAAIKRMERLLDLHDREAEKLLTSEVASHRWQVSPSMVIRLQREVEREETRRQALREECWKLARQMVMQWMQEQQAQEKADSTPEAASASEPVLLKGEKSAAVEGGDADAFSRAS